MRRAVISKNKFRFLDGSILIPDNFDPRFEAWERCNNLVHSWLLISVSSSIAQSIVYIEVAAEAWQDLKERFSQGDLVRVATGTVLFPAKFLSVTDYSTELIYGRN